MQNNVVPAVLTLAPGSGAGSMNGLQIAQPVLPGAAAPMDFAALMQTQPTAGTVAGAASGPTPVGLPPVSAETLVGEGGEAAELSPEALAALAATTSAVAAGNISGVIATKSGPVALSDFAEGDEDPDLLAALQAEEVTTPAASLATAQQMKERQLLRAPTVKPAEAGTSTEGAAATLLRNVEMLTTGDGQQVTADADATQAVTAATDKVAKATETAQQAAAPGVQQHTAGDATPAGKTQKTQLLNSTAPLPQTQQSAPAPEVTPTGESKPTLAQMAPYSMTQINAPTTQAQDATEAAPTVAEMEAKLKAEILSTSQEQGKGAAKQIDPSTAAAIKSVAAPALENTKTTSDKAAPVIARAAATADAMPQETGTAEDTLRTKVAELPQQANASGLRGRLAQAQAPAQAETSTQPAPQTVAQGQAQGQGQAQAQQRAAPLPGTPGQTVSANDTAQAQGTAPDAGSKLAYDTTKIQPDLKAELTAEMKPGVAQVIPAQTAAQPAAVAPQQAMMAGAEASAQTQATQALAQSNATAQAEAAQPQTATSQGAPMTRSLMMTDREWPTQLTAMVKEARDLTQGDIEIALQPERLGKMTIRMEMRDNAVAVTIVTDNDSSARLLNDNQARLADLMKQAGLDLTQHNASSGQQGREQAGLGGQAGGNPGGHGQSSDTNQPATAQILGGDAGTMNPAAEDDGIDILA